MCCLRSIKHKRNPFVTTRLGQQRDVPPIRLQVVSNDERQADTIQQRTLCLTLRTSGITAFKKRRSLIANALLTLEKFLRKM